MLLIGYPLDGGRMFQCILWPYVGYRQATLYAVYAGFCTMFLLLLVAFFWNEVMLLVLAFFIYTSCTQQWLLLETGGEDSLFGYDFSQGYTSLEKDPPAPPRRKQPNFFQRWLQRRAARKLQAEQQRQHGFGASALQVCHGVAQKCADRMAAGQKVVPLLAYFFGRVSGSPARVQLRQSSGEHRCEI